jgi:hypothetical protein
MYIPPLDAILRNLEISREELAERQVVEVPVSLLRFLLQLAVLNSDFDQESYLLANPDVAAAVKRGNIENPRLHYVGNGYFEGRVGGVPSVDESWYLSAYPDVAAAVQSKQILSGADHFKSTGAAELRAPSSSYELDAVQWGKALGKNTKG